MQALAPHCTLDPLRGRDCLDHLEQRVAALEAALAEHQRLLSRRG
jgi:BMFP domain-containing protein YqiC